MTPPVTPPETPSARTVTTSGQGAVRVPRDVAALDVAAVHRAATLSQALAGAESARAAVVAVARAHVDAAAVTTRGLQTWPHHDDRGRAAGFEARHALAVRCPDLGVAAALLQALADEVGDRLAVDGVSLAASPGPDDLVAAREAAYADARARAEHLAGLAGATLGEVVTLVEGPVGATPGPADALRLTKAEVGLEPGVEAVVVTVTVSWRLV